MNTKSLLLVIGMLVVLVYSATAQQERGDKILRFNGSYTKYGSTSGFAFLSLKGGYFINRNIDAGVESTTLLASGVSQFGIGLYGTYNFSTPDAKMVPYAGLRISSAMQALKLTDATGASSTHTKASGNLGLYGGLRYYLTERVNIDSGLSYDIGSINVLQWSIGVGVILGRK